MAGAGDVMLPGYQQSVKCLVNVSHIVHDVCVHHFLGSWGSDVVAQQGDYLS